MAGRQFSFFLGLTDQLGLNEAIRASGDAVFLNDRSYSEKGEEVSSSIIHDPSKESWRILIARRADLPHIRFHSTGYRNQFGCNVTYQPIVEFDRFLMFKTFLRAGRMYRVDKYWNEQRELVSKSPEFIAWADRLYKLVKQSLRKIERVGPQSYFAGEEALALRRSGIPFEGLDIEFNSMEEARPPVPE